MTLTSFVLVVTGTISTCKLECKLVTGDLFPHLCINCASRFQYYTCIDCFVASIKLSPLPPVQAIFIVLPEGKIATTFNAVQFSVTVFTVAHIPYPDFIRGRCVYCGIGTHALNFEFI